MHPRTIDGANEHTWSTENEKKNGVESYVDHITKSGIESIDTVKRCVQKPSEFECSQEKHKMK